jgi:Lon protease-like protein
MTSRLGMFPLSTVLFPEAGLPLHVFEERYRTLMGRCLESDGEFGVVLITRGSEVGGGDQRVDVGTVARIANVAELDDGRMLVVAIGVRRIRVEEWLPEAPFPFAVVEDLPDRGGACPDEVIAVAEGSLRRLRSLLSELGDVPALPHSLRISGDPDQIGWQLCDMAPLASLDLQRLLVAEGLEARMRLLSDLCDAMTGDVIGLLAGGEVGEAGDPA